MKCDREVQFWNDSRSLRGVWGKAGRHRFYSATGRNRILCIKFARRTHDAARRLRTFPRSSGCPRNAAAPRSSLGCFGGTGGPAGKFSTSVATGQGRGEPSRGERRPLPSEDPRPSVGAPRQPPSEPGGGRRCRVSTWSLKATCLRESPGGYPGHHARLAGGEGRLPPTFGPSALSVLLHFQNLEHEQLIDLFDCFGIGFFCASRIFYKHALSLLKIEQ